MAKCEIYNRVAKKTMSIVFPQTVSRIYFVSLRGTLLEAGLFTYLFIQFVEVGDRAPGRSHCDHGELLMDDDDTHGIDTEPGRQEWTRRSWCSSRSYWQQLGGRRRRIRLWQRRSTKRQGNRRSRRQGRRHVERRCHCSRQRESHGSKNLAGRPAEKSNKQHKNDV